MMFVCDGYVPNVESVHVFPGCTEIMRSHHVGAEPLEDVIWQNSPHNVLFKATLLLGNLARWIGFSLVDSGEKHQRVLSF
jgi:hypothetical protein